MLDLVTVIFMFAIDLLKKYNRESEKYKNW